MGPFIKRHLHDDINELALHAKLYPGIDIKAAITQIHGWQIAERKLPLWADTDGIIFPKHISLEQCSSQTTAEYKASIIQPLESKERMTDMTGGFGVDSVMLGRMFTHLTFVEPDEELCELAANNLPLLGIKDFSIENKRCEDVLHAIPRQDFIFIDPSRRDFNGTKVVSISECSPNIYELNQLLREKADLVMIKLSPMLNINSIVKEVQGITSMHIVSVNGECKEILAIITDGKQGNPPITCVNITDTGTQSFSFTKEDEDALSYDYAKYPKAFLYEPNASLMKACCFKSIAKRYNALQLHPNSHLYTSDNLIEDFPGRSFRVEKVLSANKHDIKELHTLEQANISIRNFPSTVAKLRQRLKLEDGGDAFIFATTLADNRKVLLLCGKVANHPKA